MALRRLKTAQDEPRWAQDGPRWPEDGPKMEPRWGQDGAKTEPKRPQVPYSYVAQLHTDADCPKSSKLASRLSEVRFLDELGSTFAVLQRYQKVSPPHPPTLRDRVGTTKHVTSYILFRYIYIYIFSSLYSSPYSYMYSSI